jgi:hypothetical protein
VRPLTDVLCSNNPGTAAITWSPGMETVFAMVLSAPAPPVLIDHLATAELLQVTDASAYQAGGVQ